MVPTEGTSLLSPTGETTHRSSSSRRRSWMKSLFKAAVPLAAAVFVIMGVSIVATSLGFDFNHKMMMQLRGGEVNLLGAVETSVDGFPTLSPTLSPVRPTGLVRITCACNKLFPFQP